MAAAGVDLLAGLDELGRMGLVEVLSHLPALLRLERTLIRVLEEGSIALVVLVDHAGMNLRLLRHASSRGIPALYYIPPKVWAWGGDRVRDLAEHASAVAAILPFEEAFLRAKGVNATFVGHPLLDGDPGAPSREEFCAATALDPERPILALMPGSRRQELHRHIPLFLRTVARVRSSVPEVQPVVARAHSVPGEALRGCGLAVTDDAQGLLHHARAGLVKSGTGTLEAALAGLPHVVTYRLHPLTAFLARRLIHVSHVSLPNLVAGREVVPEFLQDEAIPERMGAILLDLLDPSSPARARQLEGLAEVRGRMGDPGVAERVAGMAADLLRAG